MKLYSYVVEHDTGFAPNPYDNLCSLCCCKFRKSPNHRKNIVELAEVGDWIIGTGGSTKRSAGHGKLVYAMKVEEKPTRAEYYARFSDNRTDSKPPRDDFERDQQFALVSRHFYYFGRDAVDITKFDLEKKGPGFRSNFDQADIRRFLKWLETRSKPGKRGDLAPVSYPALSSL